MTRFMVLLLTSFLMTGAAQAQTGSDSGDPGPATSIDGSESVGGSGAVAVTAPGGAGLIALGLAGLLLSRRFRSSC